MTSAAQDSAATTDSELPVENTADAVTTDAPETAETIEVSEPDSTEDAPELDEALDTDEAPGLTFAEIGLPEPVVAALARNSITSPSPIQAMAIPDAIAGKNILGRAQTGSGKTLAFGLPMLARLARHDDRPAPKRPRALVLVPTRELAFQVVDSLTPYAGSIGLNVRAAVGGTPFTKQVDQLRRGVDILVATPGRLGDHLRQNTCVLDEIEMTALDEADQMADMGFLPEVRSLLGDTPDDSQRLLFSATLDNDVQALVREFLPEHELHSTQDGRASVTTMDHYVLLVERGQKDAVLAEIASRKGGRTIMFARTKLGTEGVVERLREQGVAAEALHGGKAQNQRTRVLERFKNGRTPVLVATDVAARGIHVDGIDLVVHVDPPQDHKDYLHRAGRTARAGEAGVVAAIVLPNQRRQFRRLTGMAGVDATAVPVFPGSEELAAITGAQAPSGQPVRESHFRPERRERSFGDRDNRGPRRDFGDRGPRRDFGDRDNRGPRRDDDNRGFRGNRDDRNDRPRRDFGDRRNDGESSRGDRNFSDRGPRRDFGDRRNDGGGFRENRGERSFGDRDNRGPRRDFDNRGPRRDGDSRGFQGNRDDRPRRDFGDRRNDGGGFRENRGERSFGDRDNRGPRRDFDNRGPRRDGDNRGERSFGDRDRGPRRDFGDRDNRDNRGAGYSRDDRPRRDFGDRRNDGGGFRENRGERSFGDRDNRGPRRDFDNRGPRRDGDNRDFRGNRDDRPRRDFGDRDNRGPRRDFDSRPPRRDGDTRGERSFGDRRQGGAPSEQRSNGFRSRTDRRSYDGFTGPSRDRNQ
ncbi:superfamily II DNA/RNA helicase [Rhodococcus sp. LBL1]|nr:superfamily II DNA/RNA helicase [Rhodococcus sp. LBL1]MDH6684524.1 superfamily II DNA/RNA helicase [Rhodococcus sp. LBL2]